MSSFPLERWFNLARPISKEDQRECEAQMALYVLKKGIEPSGPEWQRVVDSLRTAVKRHNAAF
jgi:hypothetical protein